VHHPSMLLESGSSVLECLLELKFSRVDGVLKEVKTKVWVQTLHCLQEEGVCTAQLVAS
jgi:hypothetical protein